MFFAIFSSNLAQIWFKNGSNSERSDVELLNEKNGMKTQNETLSERLNEVYKFAIVHNLATDKQSFSSRIGISASTLSRYLSGKKIPSNQTLLRINDACGGAFNPDWLVSGNGDMYVSVGDVTDYGTNTGQIRDDKQTAHDNNAPVFQNTGRGGNNVTQGAPASTIDSLIAEMRAQREASEKQIDRLLTIIENMQK